MATNMEYIEADILKGIRSKLPRLIEEMEQAISDIIDNDTFTTSEPEDVTALLGAARHLISGVEAS